MTTRQSPTPSLRRVLACALAGACLLTVGCRTGAPAQEVWPQVEVLPDAPPEGLDTEAATSVLRRGDDGFLYIVGGLDERATPGATFLARYSGEWPLSEVPRPPMAAGQITKRYGEDIALVQLIYDLPDTDLEELEITWEDDISKEDVGKGLGLVTGIDGEAEYPKGVTFSLGKTLGVQQGDVYALIHPEDDTDDDARDNDLQLGKRLAAICMVQEVRDGEADCRIWKGSRLHPHPSAARAGDLALFVEHTYGAPPKQAAVQFAPIEGDEDDSIREHLMVEMREYLRTHANTNIQLEELETSLDPRNRDFWRSEDLVESRPMTQIVLGAKLEEIDGEEHLIINYTGIGPAIGASMVAAPPSGGINIGRPDKFEAAQLRHIFGLLTNAVFVYRGQTAEGVMHLRHMLADETMQGSMRWHLRDQYAMYWAGLGHIDEALWLVQEDLRVATKREDVDAELNALGTIVRLYNMADAHARAIAEAKRYLEMRQQHTPDSDEVLSARSMYAEMLMSDGQATAALNQITELEEACPDGCDGSLFNYISGVLWATPEEQIERTEELLEKLTALHKDGHADSIASLRVFQGLEALYQQNYEQATVAFLEADRLYTEKKSTPGQIRAKYFTFLAQLGMEKPIDAHETAQEALKMAKDVRDYASAARIYDRLSSVYYSLDLEQEHRGYYKLAGSILFNVYESQEATGDMKASSESLFAIGSFFSKIGSIENAVTVFNKAVIYATRTTRFDIAAMSHLTLGLIARSQGNAEAFQQAIEMAQLMGRLSGDPTVLEAIQRALQPSPQQDDDDLGTKVL